MTDHLIDIKAVFGQEISYRLRPNIQLRLTGNEGINKLLSELFIKQLIAKFDYLLKHVNGQALIRLQSDGLCVGQPQLGRDILATDGLCLAAASRLHRQPVEELVFVLLLGEMMLDQACLNIDD